MKKNLSYLRNIIGCKDKERNSTNTKDEEQEENQLQGRASSEDGYTRQRCWFSHTRTRARLL